MLGEEQGRGLTCQIGLSMDRKTDQREAICQVFLESDHPLGVQEVLERAQEYVPRLGIATVYRNLKVLVESKWLHVVDLPGEPGRYELADKKHHHHFSCTRCRRVFDIHACPSGMEALLPTGFTMQRHEIILYGRCADCQPG